MSTDPTALYIDQSLHPVFLALREAMQADSKDVFLMAAGYGFSRSERADVPSKKGQIIKTSGLQPEDRALIAGMALASTDQKDRAPLASDAFVLAESYANAGLRLLEPYLTDRDVFLSWLTTEVLRTAETRASSWPFSED